MKQLYTNIHGSIGLKKGMGINDVYIDFSNLNGLTAFAGDNGKGKTSFMDNLHPFATMPSRKRGLPYQFFLRDSFRKNGYLFNGDKVEIEIKIDPEASGSNMEGYIRINDDPHSIVGGKISEYKEKIEKIFGSQTLFFNSIFSHQGSGGMGDLTPSPLRDLFAEFLRLEDMQEKHKTSKRCSEIILSEIKGLDLSIETHLKEVADIVEIEHRIDETNISIKHHDEATKKIEEDITLSTDSIKKMKEDYQKDEINRVKVGQLEKEITDLKDKHVKEVADIDLQLTDTREKWTTTSNKINQYNNIISLKDKILEAEGKLTFDREELKNLKMSMEKIQVKKEALITDISTLTNKKIIIDQEIYNINNDRELIDLKNQVKNFTEQVKNLELAGENCQDESCKLIQVALEAKKLLPITEKSLDVLTEANNLKLKSKQKELSEIRANISIKEFDKDNAITKLNSMKGLESDLNKNITDNEALSQKSPQLDIAEKNIEEIKTELKANENQGAALNKKRSESVDIGLSKGKMKGFEIIKIQEGMNQDITPEKIQIADDDLISLQSRLDTSKENLHSANSDLKVLNEKLTFIKKSKERLDELQSKKTKLLKQQRAWNWVSNGLSKERLQALKIDAAAPSIVQYANDLLSLANMENAMVQLQTQDPITGKEVLRIIVIDADGDEVILDERSGGEQTYALKPLTLAMAILSKEKSGKVYETIMADENDGALSVEKGMRFIHLYRSAMEIGAFSNCNYISHKKECVDLADNQLLFADGGIKVC